MMNETDEQKTIRLQIFDGEYAFKRGIDWPETDQQRARWSSHATSSYQGMLAVYAVSLFDEWYGPHWLGELDKLRPDAGTGQGIKNFPPNPIKELGDCMKGLRVAFAHSMGRLCALSDSVARSRGETAARVMKSVTLDKTVCDARLACPAHGGTHMRLILDAGFINEFKWVMRRVFVALEPALESELRKKYAPKSP